MNKLFCLLSLLLLNTSLFAADNVVNLYSYVGIFPDATIQQFEKETGIKVNFTSYDTNETMFAKLRIRHTSGYDVIEPSSYFVNRMRRLHMLEKLDFTKLTQFKNINAEFLNKSYDPGNTYSVPFIWGTTGIFINTDYFSKDSIKKWSDLWNTKYKDQIMFLNDTREVFSVGLRVSGFLESDNDPQHIKQAYYKLKSLLPNIKLFNSDAVVSIYIDEDATIGMAWNGDVFKAKQENPKIDYIYPEDGFVIWVDSLAIPKNPPHPNSAYQFINFMLRPDIAKKIALYNNYSTANLAAQKLLPNEIKNSPIIYPSHETLSHGRFQGDIDDKALVLYEEYWEKLKMMG